MISASGIIKRPMIDSVQNTSIGQEIDLALQCLPHQCNCLRCSVGGARALRLEEARHGLDGLLIAEVGRCRMLDQTALMELLALGKHGLRQCDPLDPPMLRATLINAEA